MNSRVPRRVASRPRRSLHRDRCAALALTLASACGPVGNAVYGPFLVEPGGGGEDQFVDAVHPDSGTVWVGFTDGELHAGDTITGTLVVAGVAGVPVSLTVPTTASTVTSGSVSFDPPAAGWSRGGYRIDVARNATVFGHVQFTVAP